MTIYVEKSTSKKGNVYIALKADLGYKSVVLTFDKNIIMEVSDLTPKDLFELPVNEKIEI